MSLADLPPSSRPREKLLTRGPQALSDAELLALLLRTGLAGTDVLQLAQQILDQTGGVAGLLHAEGQQLERIKGLGPAKRSELLAVRELARRALAQGLQERPAMDSPDAVASYLRLHLGALPHEVFAVMFLDAQLRLITLETVFQGSLTQTSVHAREIARRALQCGAAAVIVAHNHPSGVAEPSASDVSLTRHLVNALALLDVRVLDHVVVSAAGSVSMQARGML